MSCETPSPGDSASEESPPPYWFAAFVGGTVLALYLLTIAPTTQFWDTSEYIAAAKVLGIPHPPGNPLFVLLAHLWGELPIVPHYALRINIFSAVCSATASALLFLVSERFLRGIVTEQLPRYLAAFAGVFVGATSYTVWNQSVVNAKVYTLSLVSIALVLWLIVRWGDMLRSNTRPKLLLLIIYLIALGATNHLMALLVTPAVVVFVVWSDLDTLRSRRMLLWSGLVTIVGLSVFLFLIVRAPLFPPINEGEPVTWSAWWDVLMRKQYGKPPVTQRQAEWGSQLANFWQYFTWQFGNDWPIKMRRPVAAFFAVTGLYGGWRLIRSDRRAGVAMALTMFTMTIALVFYLNFKYGYSIRVDETLVREVRERDYFFLGSFQLWGVWVGLGLGAAMAALARLLSKRFERDTAWSASIIVLSLAFIPILGNNLSAPRTGETLARDFAADLLNTVEPYSILITAGDNDMFPLWYAQEVEGIRRDVLVANLSLLNTRWHLRQLQRRPVFQYEPTEAADIWSGREWDQPTNPPFAMTIEELDSLPPGFLIEHRSGIDVGNLHLVLEAGTITRSDIAVIQLIQDNLGIRPLYFAATTGGYPDGLGLTQHLASYGLARRLLPEPIEASALLVFSETIGWIDLEKAEQLAFEIYHPESAARPRPLGWTDRPSATVPAMYGLIYGELGQIIERRLASPEFGQADSARAVRARSIAEGVARNLAIGH